MARKEKEVMMIGAPDWYNTPYDKLDFEWSPEEELEIERYCERILKNIEEEEMTPIERWKAHMEGKPQDRKLICNSTLIVYATRTLDSYSGSFKVSDLIKNPKLLVKGFVATTARFKQDYFSQNIFTYTEDMWGGQAKVVDFAHPSGIGDRPIKTMEDLEKTEVPDPWTDGVLPGWLWINKELRRIIDKYNLPLPLWSSIGSDPTCAVQLGMMGWAPFFKALINEPELAKGCGDKAAELDIRIGKALIDVCKPEGLYACQNTGCMPLRGNEWVGDQLAHVAKSLKAYDPNVHLSHGYSFLSGVLMWYEVAHERGALGPDAFDGGTGGLSEGIDMRKVFEWHRDHNVHLSYSIPNEVLEEGPISRIEEVCKAMCEETNSYAKFAPGVVPVWNVPPPHLDAVVATFKKYSKS